jgi:hypothetical protein
MQKTELKIYADSKYFNVDLFDNEPIELTKSIIELTEPEQRKSDYTKTINIPGTANNNSIFTNIFDVNHSILNGDNSNFYVDFDPRKKANCILYREGIPQLRGYLQMTSINILDEQNITYELVVYGRVANLFQDVGDNLLSDYDFSEYTHVWNETNVRNSINTSIIINGVTAAFQYGRGYVYPLIDYGFDNNAQQTYNVDQLYPAIYVKTILDKILKTHGYRYESTIQSNNFLNSTDFKRLIIPSSGNDLRLIKLDVAKRTFVVDRTSDNNLGAATNSIDKLIFNRTVQDTIPTGVAANHSSWIAPTLGGGEYKFVLKLFINAELNSSVTLPSGYNISFLMNVYIRTNTGSVFRMLTSQPVNMVADNRSQDLSFVFQTDNRFVPDGEEVDVYWRITNLDLKKLLSANIPLPVSDLNIIIKTGTEFYSLPKPELSEGSNINPTSALPELKAKDFLTALIKMFNLYIEPNQLDDRLLTIEPRDIYYNDNVVDLTNNLDVSKDFIQKPMGALDFKQLEFSYAMDDDYWNKDYTDKYNYNHGFKRLDVKNDFLVETKKIELPFAPTPLGKPTSDRIIPQIVWWKDQNSVNGRVNKTAKPRILYYGGLKNTGKPLTISSYASPRKNTQYSSYGYAGHIDDPANPNYDLNWATSQEIYYTIGGQTPITINNLYKRYWEKYIKEITDKDSKIIECYMYFNNVELQNLSFRNLYKIDRQYYRLYKVETDLNSNEPAKCQFLKLKNINVPLADQVLINGGSETITGERYTPIISQTPNRIDVINQRENFSIEVGSAMGITDYRIEPKSQFIKVNNNVYLPPANASFDFDNNKSIEVKIYNNHSGSIRVYTTPDAHHSVASNSGIVFYSDGTNWYHL